MIKKIIIVNFLISACFSSELTINMEQAIKLALKNNSLNKISKMNLEMAKAQYKQALSANYPSLDSVFYFNRDDRDTIFKQRGAFNLPANFAMFGVSSISADIDTVAYGRDTASAELQLNYPLYTGGKISAAIEKARLNEHIKKEAIIRKENEIIFDVKKYFYGYILTDELYSLIDEMNTQVKVAEELTKNFMEEGSDLKINRTDYLNIKLLSSITQSVLTKIELNKKLLENAIANVIGLNYNDEVHILYDEKEVLKQNLGLQELIKKAYTLNPDINTIALAIKVKKQEILEKKADYYPMVNLYGNLSYTYNSYRYGYLGEDDRRRWKVGIAIKLPLFSGFRTKNQVLEKRIDKKKMDEKMILLEKGLALQLKNEFLKSSLGYKQIQSLRNTVKLAKENSDLNFKSYRYEMTEMKDLVQSKIMELYVRTDYFNEVHNYLLSLATIDKLIGTKVEENYF